MRRRGKKVHFLKNSQIFWKSLSEKSKILRFPGLAVVLTGNYDISVWYPWKAVDLNFLMDCIS